MMSQLINLGTKSSNQLRQSFVKSYIFVSKYSTNQNGQKSLQKVEEINQNELQLEKRKNSTFAQLFRRSKFVSLGDLENKVLYGKIFDVNGDDLYIDYGGKFNAVCKKPEKDSK